MIRVELDNSSAVKGDPILVRVSHERIYEFAQLQIEVFNTCVAHPSSRLGFGTKPTRCGENMAEVQIDTGRLVCGIYEVRLIRFHTPIGESQEQKLDFIRLRDFPRLLFEVIDSEEKRRTATELKTEVESCEAALEKEFQAPVEIFEPGVVAKIELSALVFVRDVLIGTTVRLNNIELVPTGSGLDSQDALNFVNSFLRERTKTGISFPYDESVRQNSRSSNPVCVVHFPHIVASNFEHARDYCHEKVDSLLLALSLMRDASGEVFEIVLIDRASGRSTKYSISSPYVGNMLTGNLSGESAEQMHTYLTGLDTDSFSAFLVNLYKQGRRERSPDYQYLRFWQILEVIADNNNYDSALDLLDFEGKVIMDGERPRKCKGSVNTVFALLRDEGIGTTDDTWAKVNIWFAFRSAVAHHGAISRFSALSRQNVVEWAKLGFEVVSKTGHDKYLWSLKEDTKLLLMRRLVNVAQNK